MIITFICPKFGIFCSYLSIIGKNLSFLLNNLFGVLIILTFLLLNINKFYAIELKFLLNYNLFEILFKKIFIIKTILPSNISA
jgi:hypothetical protein